MQYIDELKALGLPSDQYAVFGSGPMAIRNIRRNNDVDIIVTSKLWDELSKKHGVEDRPSFRVGNIEIWRDQKPYFDDIVHLIDDADICDGIRYVRLKYLIEWKSMRNSSKDIEDIDRMKVYLDLYGDGMTRVFE